MFATIFSIFLFFGLQPKGERVYTRLDRAYQKNLDRCELLARNYIEKDKNLPEPYYFVSLVNNMKKVLLSITLLLVSVVAKAQFITEVKVDSMCMFEYSDTLSFEDAWDNGYITNLGIIRRYNETSNTWVINKLTKEITFGICDPSPYVENGDVLEYTTYLGKPFKLFLKEDKETKQNIVFFLENSVDGKIKGGFTYPNHIVSY